MLGGGIRKVLLHYSALLDRTNVGFTLNFSNMIPQWGIRG